MSSGGRRLSLVESVHSGGAADGEDWAALRVGTGSGPTATGSAVTGRTPVSAYLSGRARRSNDDRPSLHMTTAADTSAPVPEVLQGSGQHTEAFPHRHEDQGEAAEDGDDEDDEEDDEDDDSALLANSHAFPSGLLSPDTAAALAAALAYKTGLKKRRRRGALKKRLSPMPKRRRRNMGAVSLTSAGSGDVEAFLSGSSSRRGGGGVQGGSYVGLGQVQLASSKPAWVTRSGRSVIAKVRSPEPFSSPDQPSGNWRTKAAQALALAVHTQEEGPVEEEEPTHEYSTRGRKGYTPRTSRVERPSQAAHAPRSIMHVPDSEQHVSGPEAQCAATGGGEETSVPSEIEERGVDATMPVEPQERRTTPFSSESCGTNSRVSSYVGSASDRSGSAGLASRSGAAAMPVYLRQDLPAAPVWTPQTASMAGSYPALPRAFPPLPLPPGMPHHVSVLSPATHVPPMSTAAHTLHMNMPAAPRRAPPKGATVWTRGGESVRVDSYGSPSMSSQGGGVGYASPPSAVSQQGMQRTQAYKPYTNSWFSTAAEVSEDVESASHADSTVQHSPTGTGTAGVDEAHVLMQMMVGAVRSAAQEATRQALASVHAHGQHPSAVTYTYSNMHPGQSMPTLDGMHQHAHSMHMNMYTPGGPAYISYMGAHPRHQ